MISDEIKTTKEEVIVLVKDQKQKAPRNIFQLFENRAKETPSNLAMAYADKEYTFEELFDMMCSTANSLLEWGVQPGDIVYILGGKGPVDNRLSSYIMGTATNFIGAWQCPIITAITDPNQLLYILNHSKQEKGREKNPRGKALFMTAEWLSFYEKYKDELGHLGVVILDSTEVIPEGIAGGRVSVHLFQEALECSPDPSSFPGVGSKDMALISYTSGTTGKPKGVLQTQGSVVASAMALGEHLGPEPGEDSILIALPIYHIFGLLALLLNFHRGVLTVLTQKFSPKSLPAIIKKYHPTIMPCAPPHLKILTNMAAGGQINVQDFAGIMFIVGADALPETVRKEFETQFSDKDGNVVVTIESGYGMTENMIVASAPKKGDKGTRRGFSGSVVPPGKIKIADLLTGEELPEGGVGEICTYGDSTMDGYYLDEKAAAEAIDKKKWLHTGDVGFVQTDQESGRVFVRITSRIKNMAILGGENVSLPSVEERVLELAGVANVVAVKAGEIGGERIVMCILRKVGSDVSVDDVMGFCKEKLEKWAVPLPEDVIFVMGFPTTPLNKVQRNLFEQPSEENNSWFRAPEKETIDAAVLINGLNMQANLFNNSKTKPKGFETVMVYKFFGSKGFAEFTMSISDGVCIVVAGGTSNPNSVVMMNASTMAAIFSLAHKLNGPAAVAGGAIQGIGNYIEDLAKFSSAMPQQ